MEPTEENEPERSSSGRDLGPYRSRLVPQVRQLNPKVQRAIGATGELLALWDLITTASKYFTNDDDRPWHLRMGELIGSLDQQFGPETVVAAAPEWTADTTQRWTRRIRSGVYDRAVRRLVGAAAYDKLKAAFLDDAAAIVLASRRALRALMPLLVAWEDSLAILTVEQLERLPPEGRIETGLFSAVVQLDHIVGDEVVPRLPLVESTAAKDTDLDSLTTDDLELLADQLRVVISAESQAHIEAVDSYLTRKIRGARDALEFSVDGISQAANSLIELIDHLLRAPFADGHVLEWINTHLAYRADELTYTDAHGERQPTKRAEALCYVYAGKPPASSGTTGVRATSFIHEVMATALVAARTELQGLKHARHPDPEDRQCMQRLLAAVEGALTLSVRLSWYFANLDGPSDLAEAA